MTLHQILMGSKRYRHIFKDDSFFRQFLFERMINDFAIILGSYSCKHVLFCLRNPESVKGCFYSIRNIIPGV